MTKEDTDDTISLFPQPNNSIRTYKQIIPVSIHHFYITDEIEEVDPYLDMINVLHTAEPHDRITIFINSPGGDLYTAIQIINAIKQSEAEVTTSIVGNAASAAGMIFLSGHKFLINPNISLMIHSYSSVSHGKSNELVSQIKFSETHFRKLAQDIYGGFLTNVEIDSVINGTDLWISSDQIKERLRNISEELISNEDAAQLPESPAKKLPKKKIIKKK